MANINIKDISLDDALYLKQLMTERRIRVRHDAVRPERGEKRFKPDFREKCRVEGGRLDRLIAAAIISDAEEPASREVGQAAKPAEDRRERAKPLMPADMRRE